MATSIHQIMYRLNERNLCTLQETSSTFTLVTFTFTHIYNISHCQIMYKVYRN